jgi:hypothetical protein
LRYGRFSVAGGAFQRLGVSPDGSVVVFEVTNDFAAFTDQIPLRSEEEGMFVVRSDGTGLRRIGPASSVPPFGIREDPSIPVAGFTFVYLDENFAFSPDGRTIAFPDISTSSGGVQIVTVDLESGRRTEVTSLPPTPLIFPSSRVAPCAECRARIPDHLITGYPQFLDNNTILFYTSTLQPEFFSVRRDGTMAVKPLHVPDLAAAPTSDISQALRVTRGSIRVLTLGLPDGIAQNPPGFSSFFSDQIRELFLVDGKHFLQLTNFRRADTGAELVTRDKQRVVFVSSGNPRPTRNREQLARSNPSENCQLFSIDRTGTGLRQLTNFRESDGLSIFGCRYGPAPLGCLVARALQDPVTRTIIFYSSCDPFGLNPNGGQLFAMRPNGRGLHQLTDTRGQVSTSDGSVTVELPGPFAYSAR